MPPFLKLSLALLILAPLAGCVNVPANGKADAPPTPVVVRQDGWVRWVPPASRNSAIYFTIENPSLAADVLIGASSPRARVAELHRTVEVGLAKSMQRVDGVLIGEASRLELSPGGYHIMLIDLVSPLQEGERIPLSLEFKRSGKMDVSFPVMMMYGGEEQHEHHHQ